jgi:hypothetical protein
MELDQVIGEPPYVKHIAPSPTQVMFLHSIFSQTDSIIKSTVLSIKSPSGGRGQMKYLETFFNTTYGT